MTESDHRPAGHRTNILVIPLPDARPRPTPRFDLDPASGPVRAPGSDQVGPAPDVQPTAPIPDAPAPSSDWIAEPDDDEEDAVGQWYVTRPLSDTHQRPRVRASSPTGRVHLMAFAIAIPCIGAAGILATVVDTLSAGLAKALPAVILLGVVAAWLFLSRPGAWVRGLIGTVIRLLRR